MKKKINIFFVSIISFLLILALAGCQRFLDRKPLGATLSDLGSGTLDGQSYALYNTLRYAGFSTLPWLDFNSIRDDDAQKGSSTTDGAEINAEFETFQYTKDDWGTDTYWNDHYSMINLANTEIYIGRDSLKVTDEPSLRDLGEAHFFRAYSFFELVKAYGEVPLLNFYFTNPADGNKPKASVDDIYAQIDADLDTAAMYLPLNWNDANGQNQFPGRLTSGAAKTLWAQTYLFRKQWDKVKSLCEDVIASGQYQLVANFTDLWKDGLNGAGKNSAESIFEMQSLVGQNGTPYYGVQWGTSQEVRQGGASGDWNLGWGWNTPTQHLVNDWSDSDPRKNKTILYSGQSDGGAAEGGFGATLPPYNKDSLGKPGFLDQPYWNKKVYTSDDPAMRAYTGEVGACCGGADWVNHRILRYADVLLMLAEASNELGDGATAENMLEQVRARARGGDNSALPHIAYTSQSQMRTAIKNERRWEFAMEGYRFYDLVRWGDAQSALGGLGYQPKNAWYPIPQPAIDLSGGVLKQNPNY